MKPLSLSVLIFALASLAVAEDQPKVGDFGKAPSRIVRAKVAFSNNSQTAAISSSPIREVIAKDVTIAANDHAIFEVASDFSGADKVGLAVTTLSDSNSSMARVRFAIAWAAPGDWYVLTDVVLGSSFYYLDHGGATVPVYGPFLKVVVFNDGTTPVKITQLSVNAVAR